MHWINRMYRIVCKVYFNLELWQNDKLHSWINYLFNKSLWIHDNNKDSFRRNFCWSVPQYRGRNRPVFVPNSTNRSTIKYSGFLCVWSNKRWIISLKPIWRIRCICWPTRPNRKSDAKFLSSENTGRDICKYSLNVIDSPTYVNDDRVKYL